MAKARPVTQKDKWETPGHIYNKLNQEFNFTLDPCCEPNTAKCAKYYTMEDDGLSKSWEGETVFVNPPYSAGNIDRWTRKCYEESLKPNTIVVALIPVSTSAKWWHSYVLNKGQLRYVERRIQFEGAAQSAPFSNVIIVYGESGSISFKQQPTCKPNRAV